MLHGRASPKQCVSPHFRHLVHELCIMPYRKTRLVECDPYSIQVVQVLWTALCMDDTFRYILLWLSADRLKCETCMFHVSCILLGTGHFICELAKLVDRWYNPCQSRQQLKEKYLQDAFNSKWLWAACYANFARRNRLSQYTIPSTVFHWEVYEELSLILIFEPAWVFQINLLQYCRSKNRQAVSCIGQTGDGDPDPEVRLVTGPCERHGKFFFAASGRNERGHCRCFCYNQRFRIREGHDMLCDATETWGGAFLLCNAISRETMNDKELSTRQLLLNDNFQQNHCIVYVGKSDIYPNQCNSTSQYGSQALLSWFTWLPRSRKAYSNYFYLKFWWKSNVPIEGIDMHTNNQNDTTWQQLSSPMWQKYNSQQASERIAEQANVNCNVTNGKENKKEKGSKN